MLIPGGWLGEAVVELEGGPSILWKNLNVRYKGLKIFLAYLHILGPHFFKQERAYLYIFDHNAYGMNVLKIKGFGREGGGCDGVVSLGPQSPFPVLD